ncbi:unnamed protein product [Linum tenue]|uniref:Uncharacterized protein n=1 Tax=Linum tenue TaxID=586396 RepID=A0AAV0QWD4_9ROSI|nr:unnamed protein product [Linum tenue]
MVRPPACCGNANLRRGLWTPEEDAKILAYVSKHGTGNWTSIPKKAGLRRCGKSCRLRWNNYLRPDLNHESFTQQEEEMIVRLHAAIGSRWSIIAQQLPGRTDNDVKNHWNTKLRKKLSEMGIDPVTHKPFSQILADYGNINGGLSRPSAASAAATRSSIGSLSRDLKNVAHLFVSNNNNNNHPDKHHQHNYSSLPPQSSITAAAHFMEQPEEILPITTECFVGNKGEGGGGEEEESMDLMDQLQAIKLVTEAAAAAAAAGGETNYYNDDEGMAAMGGSPFPSSSSSSSTCSTAAAAAAEMKKSATTTTTATTPPLSFSWRDFLLEDDDAGGGAQFPPENDGDLNVNNGELSSSGEQQSLAAAAGEGGMSRGVIGCSNSGSADGGGYANVSSFVEAILNEDERRDVFLDFPNLLQDPTYYH